MQRVIATGATRRRVGGKRTATMLRLTDAAAKTLRRVGYHELTLPAVAAEAKLARATAYIYFSSREHLVAELYWQRLVAHDLSAHHDAPLPDRVAAVLRGLIELLADEPALALAVNIAMNSNDSDVHEIRRRSIQHIHQLLLNAADGSADEQALTMLEMMYTGAIVRAAIDGSDFAGVADQLDAAARRLLAT